MHGKAFLLIFKNELYYAILRFSVIAITDTSNATSGSIRIASNDEPLEQ